MTMVGVNLLRQGALASVVITCPTVFIVNGHIVAAPVSALSLLGSIPVDRVADTGRDGSAAT
jgi:hypothetical protein